jgi:hypothetical protein
VYHISVALLLVPTIIFILPEIPPGLTAVFSTCLSSRTASLCLLLHSRSACSYFALGSENFIFSFPSVVFTPTCGVAHSSVHLFLVAYHAYYKKLVQYWYLLKDTATLHSGVDFIHHQIIHISEFPWPRQNQLHLLPTDVRSVPDIGNSNKSKAVFGILPASKERHVFVLHQSHARVAFFVLGGGYSTNFLIF